MKKLLMLLLSAMLCCSLAFGVICASAQTEEGNDVIAILDHEITQADWDSAKAYTMTPVSADTTGATGTVKLLATETRLYFLMEVQDATNFDADRPDYTITVGGKTASARGKFIDAATQQPWLAGRNSDFGDAVKTESTYADGAYRLEIGYDLGDVFVVGAEVAVDFSAADAQTAEQGWADDYTSYPHAIRFAATLTLGEAEQPGTEEPEPEQPGVVAVLDHEITQADWDSAKTYTMTPVSADTTGATGTVKLLATETRLYFLMEVQDATNFDADRPDYTITVGGKTASARGKFIDAATQQPWLAGRNSDFGDAVKTESTYADGAYRLEIGYDLGDVFVVGAEVAVDFSAADAQTAEQGWADDYTSYPHAIRFAATLTLGETEQPGTEEPEPEPEQPGVVAVLDHEITQADWDSAKAYTMTPVSADTTGATGTVKLLATETRLYFLMEVQDATQFINDRPDYSVTIGGKTASARGQYIGSDGAPWLNPRSKDFGNEVKVDISYANGAYRMELGFDIGADLFVEGAHIVVDFSHADAQTAEQGWDDNYTSYPHAIRFADTLYLGAYSETDPVAPDPEEPGTEEPDPEQPGTEDPEPTPGPENVDLKIVVTDLVSQPKEEDWENAVSYEMLPNTGNITGATGTVKVYTAAKNIFFRMEVNDPTTCYNQDGIYVYLGVEDCYLETRGNYDLWLSAMHNDLGQPSLLAMSTTAADKSGYGEGTYIFEYGFYIPDIYEPGATIRLCVKHRDSRSSSEAWQDGDYAHTIYFDQILTFGEAADTTVRPQEPTQGFTASVEEISYNKASAAWSEFEGAETYKFYVYAVNGADAEEPYTHLSIEGPIYAGSASYSEEFLGLSASTGYAIQVVAYDGDDNVIGYSSLAEFETISREEALNPGGDDNDDQDPDGDKQPDTSDPDDEKGDGTQEKKGCGSTVSGGFALAAALLAGGAAVLLAKKRGKE